MDSAHFGRWIRGFHFVPLSRRQSIPCYDATKGDFLTRAGDVAALIDDHRGNVGGRGGPGDPRSADAASVKRLSRRLSEHIPRIGESVIKLSDYVIEFLAEAGL